MNAATYSQKDESAAFRDLVKELNSFGSDRDIKNMVRQFRTEHRTLQQSVGRLIYAIIRAGAMDYQDDRYDLRNEAFLKFCHEAEELVNDNPLPFI